MIIAYFMRLLYVKIHFEWQDLKQIKDKLVIIQWTDFLFQVIKSISQGFN